MTWIIFRRRPLINLIFTGMLRKGTKMKILLHYFYGTNEVLSFNIRLSDG